MPTYLQGLTIGLAYVAPIGMQNLFVINSALTQPRRRALLTALIVIAFDISLALACFFGIGALVERFDWLQRLILIVGGCIVVWIGIGLLRDICLFLHHLPEGTSGFRLSVFLLRREVSHLLL